MGRTRKPPSRAGSPTRAVTVEGVVTLEAVVQRLAEVSAISPWVFVLVFIGGGLSALSPCYLPVLIWFSGFIGGFGRGGTGGGAPEGRADGVGLGVAFIAGMTLTLALVGAVAGSLGKAMIVLFAGYDLDRWIPGLLGLAMSLHLLGLYRLPLPGLGGKGKAREPDTRAAAFMVGLPFGMVITPCTLPVFATVLAFAALRAGPLLGALLLAVYNLGRAAVLLAVAAFADLVAVGVIERRTRTVERAAGVILLLASLYLLFLQPFSRMPWEM